MKSTGSELAFLRVLRLRKTLVVSGLLRKTSDFFGKLRKDLVVFKHPSTPRIKISRLHLRKSWQVYDHHDSLNLSPLTRPEFCFVITLRKCIFFLKIIISLSVILFHFLKKIEEQLKKRGITKDKDVSEIYLANRLSLYV